MGLTVLDRCDGIPKAGALALAKRLARLDFHPDRFFSGNDLRDGLRLRMSVEQLLQAGGIAVDEIADAAAIGSSSKRDTFDDDVGRVITPHPVD